jgi:hypothetical protein
MVAKNIRLSPIKNGQTIDDDLFLVSPRMAARFLNLSHRTLESWRIKGYGPRFVFISARRVKYRRSDLREWIAGQLREQA